MQPKIILLLITALAEMLPNVYAVFAWNAFTNPWEYPVDSLRVPSWLPKSQTYTVLEFILANGDNSCIEIIHSKELNKYFFFSYTYTYDTPDLWTVHMISQLGDSYTKVKAGAENYYKIFGEEFYKADFDFTTGNQRFNWVPKFLANLMPSHLDLLKDTLTAKATGKKVSNLVKSQIRGSSIDHVDAYSELYEAGKPFLSIHYQFTNVPKGSVFQVDVVHNYPQ